MTKLQFLLALHEKLSTLPKEDVEERLNFYSEMIEDRMEEGLSEEEAVLAVGSVDEIAAQIAQDIPPKKDENKKIKGKRQLKTWEIVLIAVGSPIWFSLLVVAFAVAISLYAALWSVIICLWAVFGSLAACSVGMIVTGVVFALTGTALQGIALIAASLVCAGLSVFLLLGCKAATKGTVVLTGKLIAKCFAKKEEA